FVSVSEQAYQSFGATILCAGRAKLGPARYAQETCRAHGRRTSGVAYAIVAVSRQALRIDSSWVVIRYSTAARFSGASELFFDQVLQRSILQRQIGIHPL